MSGKGSKRRVEDAERVRRNWEQIDWTQPAKPEPPPEPKPTDA